MELNISASEPFRFMYDHVYIQYMCILFMLCAYMWLECRCCVDVGVFVKE